MQTSCIQIGVFGRRGCGKSSLIQAFKNKISFENNTSMFPHNASDNTLVIFPRIGPVALIDTQGIDNPNEDMGPLRIIKTLELIQKIDLALLILVNNEFTEYEQRLTDTFFISQIPFIIVHNKSDIVPLLPYFTDYLSKQFQVSVVECSAKNIVSLDLLVDSIIKIQDN